jgi:hypothetical protein
MSKYINTATASCFNGESGLIRETGRRCVVYFECFLKSILSHRPTRLLWPLVAVAHQLTVLRIHNSAGSAELVETVVGRAIQI